MWEGGGPGRVNFFDYESKLKNFFFIIIFFLWGEGARVSAFLFTKNPNLK